MTVESATYTSGLNASNPASGDPFIEGDDHIRLLKSTIKATFPNVTGAVTATQGDLNTLTGAAGVVVLSSSGVGYGAGAGGAVTQATSKSTAVTLNKACGQINVNAASLAASTTVTFTLNNSLIASTDIVLVQYDQAAASQNYSVWVSLVANGQAYINIRNSSGAPLAESLVIRFALHKVATS